MPHDLYDWLRRIKSVERQFAAARFAVDYLLGQVARDLTIVRPVSKSDLKVRDITLAAQQLEPTYIIRLFAEFETALRLFWPTAKRGDPPARTRDLLDGIAAARRIPTEQIRLAHLVREYRNALVHQRESSARSLSMREACGHLCWFFSFLPPKW